MIYLKSLFKKQKYFTFLGNLKYKKIDDMFDSKGNIIDSVYNELDLHVWHFNSKSYGTLIYILSDVTTNVKSLIRIK